MLRTEEQLMEALQDSDNEQMVLVNGMYWDHGLDLKDMQGTYFHVIKVGYSMQDLTIFLLIINFNHIKVYPSLSIPSNPS